MKVKAPNDVVEYIRSKFTLVEGEVIYRRTKDHQFGTCAKFNGNTYSKSYVKDVLEGKDPDLSVLFNKVDGQLFRNNDPVWGARKGKIVTKNGAKVCGVPVTNEEPRPPTFKRSELKHIELKRDTLALEPLVASEYERWCFKDRFRLLEGEVVYRRDGKPFGGYARINDMRYSKGYVQQVLEDKNPDISDLFELRDGVVCRSQDPIWGQAKGAPISLALICGVIFTREGYVIPEKQEPEQPEYLGDPD